VGADAPPLGMTGPGPAASPPSAGGVDLGLRARVDALLELTKARITVFVTASVATGHFLFVGHVGTSVLMPMLGVFLLACGSAAMNQVQEARFDALMPRTQNRPIPSGRIARDWALFVALALIGAGLWVLTLIQTHAVTLLGLGLLSVVWYNGVYLWLKRVTAFAVVPGSLVGAIPPVIGWSAGGGMPLDGRILEVAGFFFLWQIPHFWLLLLLYGKEYEEAGLPSATRNLDPRQFGRITLAWIVAVAATGLVLAVRQRFGVPWNVLAAIAALWLVWTSLASLPRWPERKAVVQSFLRINFYALVTMILLSLHALVGGL
jgi:protoheme IX farnesyltransferase